MDMGRSPHGERGLKSVCVRLQDRTGWSLPAWGAWIEILKPGLSEPELRVAPRMGSVD